MKIDVLIQIDVSSNYLLLHSAQTDWPTSWQVEKSRDAGEKTIITYFNGFELRWKDLISRGFRSVFPPSRWLCCTFWRRCSELHTPVLSFQCGLRETENIFHFDSFTGAFCKRKEQNVCRKELSCVHLQRFGRIRHVWNMNNKYEITTLTYYFCV